MKNDVSLFVFTKKYCGPIIIYVESNHNLIQNPPTSVLDYDYFLYYYYYGPTIFFKDTLGYINFLF